MKHIIIWMAVIFEVCMSNGMRGKSVVLSGILEKEVHPKMQDSWCLNDSLSNDSTKLGIKKNILFWDTFSPLILFSKFGVSYERFLFGKKRYLSFVTGYRLFLISGLSADVKFYFFNERNKSIYSAVGAITAQVKENDLVWASYFFTIDKIIGTITPLGIRFDSDIISLDLYTSYTIGSFEYDNDYVEFYGTKAYFSDPTKEKLKKRNSLMLFPKLIFVGFRVGFNF